LAPFTENATGIITNIGRRPKEEWTTRNRNLAALYAVTQVTRLADLIPTQNPIDLNAQMLT